MDEYYEQIDGRIKDFWELDPYRMVFGLFVGLSAAVLISGCMIAVDPPRFIPQALPIIQYGSIGIILYVGIPTIIIWWPCCFCKRYAAKPVSVRSPMVDV
jgi:hypothetical protein